MAGYVKGSKAWHQMMVSKLFNDIRRAHEYPETDEHLKKLTKDLGHYIDNILPVEHKPRRSASDVMIEKIFD